LHEHPDHPGPGAAVRHRLGRASRAGAPDRDPARCAQPRRGRPAAHRHRRAHRRRRRGRRARRQLPGRARHRNRHRRGGGLMGLSGAASIAGIGATEFSKESGRTELRLAAEAVLDALDDAGLAPSEVDGMVTFTQDASSETAVAREIGAGPLRFFGRVDYGGGAACATVGLAAKAVATGQADAVVAYRAFNERSGRRFGRAMPEAHRAPTSQGLEMSWHVPFGLVTPAAWVAMCARRYMAASGATSEDFGRVAVAARRHAATNPAAWFHGRPITLEEHQASRWITEPLRLLDCCQESDGGVALVVVSAERARSLRRPPAVIAAAAQGSAPGQQTM